MSDEKKRIADLESRIAALRNVGEVFLDALPEDETFARAAMTAVLSEKDNDEGFRSYVDAACTAVKNWCEKAIGGAMTVSSAQRIIRFAKVSRILKEEGI